jgi:hypothetical protein
MCARPFLESLMARERAGGSVQVAVGRRSKCMTGRSIWAGLILTTLTPAIALSQGLEIDHKAVGCIVVGKYPKMNACFTPAANLARSRVYFRPEGTPSWYYVDM